MHIKRWGISHFIPPQPLELCYYEGIDFLSDIQASKDCRSHNTSKSNKEKRDLLKTPQKNLLIGTHFPNWLCNKTAQLNLLLFYFSWHIVTTRMKTTSFPRQKRVIFEVLLLTNWLVFVLFKYSTICIISLFMAVSFHKETNSFSFKLEIFHVKVRFNWCLVRSCSVAFIFITEWLWLRRQTRAGCPLMTEFDPTL